MKVYGGFVDGKLDWRDVDDGLTIWRQTPAVFKRRQEALVQYEDVRRIEITEEPPKRRQSR